MMPKNKFCEFCQKLVKLASLSGEDPGAFSIEKKTRFQETASSCALCGLLCNTWQQYGGEQAFLDYDATALLPHKISVGFNFSYVPGDEQRVSDAELELENHVTSQPWYASLALWATQGISKF